MARIARSKLIWTGFTGAPGYSVFHGSVFQADAQQEATDFSEAVAAFGSLIAPYLPNAVSVQRVAEVEILEDSTGTLEDVLTVPGRAAAQGSGGTNYAAPIGAVIGWNTGRIRNGRRMRGRTFVVPLANSAYETDGSLLPAVVTGLTTAANTLLQAAGTELLVYGRPTPLAADGVSGVVTGVRVPDMAAVLRSRRD